MLERPASEMSRAHDLRIRVMRPDEIALAADWAAAEGWNPGLADAACFATVDPGGFFIGEVGGAPAASVSCVNYDERFAFLGFYIVRGDLRGRGYGLRIWNAAIAHARPRTIGLDGVVAQQGNYRKSGFQLAYANIRYGGSVAPLPAPPAGIVPLTDVPFASVEADDATGFPGPGSRIGPLVADDRAAAEAIFAALVAAAGPGQVFLDVPSVNRDAVALTHDHGLAPVFETARMYTGAIRPVRLERVFGVTTFELG